VLDAAIELLGRRPDASMDDIAAAAGVSRQTVYAHYPSRQALTAAILGRLTSESVRVLDAVEVDAGSARDGLCAWLEASWGLIYRYPVLLTRAVAESGTGDEYERHEPVMDSLLRVLRRGQRSGEVDVAHPVHWYVTAIIALGHAAGAEVMADRMTPVEAGAAFRDAVVRVTVGTPGSPPSGRR